MDLLEQALGRAVRQNRSALDWSDQVNVRLISDKLTRDFQYETPLSCKAHHKLTTRSIFELGLLCMLVRSEFFDHRSTLIAH